MEFMNNECYRVHKMCGVKYELQFEFKMECRDESVVCDEGSGE